MHFSIRTEVVYVLGDFLKAFGPYHMRFPPRLMDSLDNGTWSVLEEGNYRDISDIIEMSVVPTQKGDDIQSCMTYNPPGPFETGYDVIRSVSKFALFNLLI